MTEKYSTIYDVPCICNTEKPVAKAILPIKVNTPKVVVFNSCPRTLLAASFRQAKAMPASTPEMREKFKIYCDKIFEKEIRPLLVDFKYSYNAWYNHLELSKQKELKDVDYSRLNKYQYTNFSKREIQEEGGKARNISAPNVEVKHVMGPVIWQLEHIFGNNFKGYCSNANYGDLATCYEDNYNLGRTATIQGDGSGYDLSQKHEDKYIDRLVYDYLADTNKITHVSNEEFRLIANMRYRDIKLQTIIDGKYRNLGKLTLDATVGSGSPDTTFGNTLRMSMYNRFVLEEIAGLTTDDYDIKVKGDDFVVMVNPMNTIDIEKKYYEFFVAPDEFDEEKDDRKEIKSGHILKFLKIGGYEDIDFCSTAVIHREGQFAVVRKIDRLVHLAHWSMKALSYSKPQLCYYYKAISKSISAWAHDYYFYRDYAKAMMFQHDVLYNKLDSKQLLSYKAFEKLANRESKETLLVEEYYRPNNRENHIFGRDYCYAMQEKISEKKQFTDEAIKGFLLERYGLIGAVLEKHIENLYRSNCYDEINGSLTETT